MKMLPNTDMPAQKPQPAGDKERDLSHDILRANGRS